ncbi:NF-kappa-B-repressing factor [Papilio xuthus]|uniref:NF-kappa-B-repressing factor n=1 Tax=Papilio xuthus TaxID=66420 RepID=A0A194PSR3_PAPXU|nr:NF-kappa-B-repressing factor [Papilio xuthus]
MSFDVSWSVDKYKEDHESEDHWNLRKAFMERWKHDYPEERLVCLGRVFANMEFMGCRYPAEVMLEVSRLAEDVATNYRKSRLNKLQRTFVSASTAAEDRAKGVKRKGGVIDDGPSTKSKKINFVPQGHSNSKDSGSEDEAQTVNELDNDKCKQQNDKKSSEITDFHDYFKEMTSMQCLDVTKFHEGMFHTDFGRMILLIRPWTSKLSNIQASCSVCHVPVVSKYENKCFTLTMDGKLVAQATGPSKAEARSNVATLAWNKLRESAVSVLVKEQWIAQGERVSVSDVGGRQASEAVFGTPIANSVATKMMKLMGWKGGGLGSDAQGIEEPIKPNLQMVNRAGLGSDTTDVRELRRAAHNLMRRYIASDTFDLDLVFSSDFSKEERAVLHQCAQKSGLASKSYGHDKDNDRFLVVRKKLDPFSLVRAIVQKGGVTPKYQVFIPIGLDRRRKR